MSARADHMQMLAKLNELRADEVMKPFADKILKMYLKEDIGAKSISRQLDFKVSKARIVRFLRRTGVYQPGKITPNSVRVKKAWFDRIDPNAELFQEHQKDMSMLKAAKGRASWTNHPEANKWRANKAYHEKYAKDPEFMAKQRVRAKRIYRKNPAKKLEQCKKWREENPEKIKEFKKKWNNSAKAKAYQKEYQSRPEQRIVRNLKHRFKDITGKNAPKLTDFIGCNTAFLKTHLEGQFKRGMKWSNYGSFWFVRIIKPCASFNLNVPKQVASCFNWQNLKPEKVGQKRRKCLEQYVSRTLQ